MTIASTTNRNDYTGNGSVSAYDYVFRIFDQDDLRVTVRNTSDVETTLTISTDYTVSGVGEEGGGTVTLVNSGQAWLTAGKLTTGYIITIRRVRALLQETDIRNQGDFFAEAHEDEFDRGVMIAQQQQDELDRSIKLPETVDPADFDTLLPPGIVGEANVTIMTNSAGDGFETGPSAAAISAAAANAAAAAASASAAASSASAASTSASNASTSASNAATSASNAATSETNAAASAASINNIAIFRTTEFKTFADSPVTLVAGDLGKLYSVDCSGGAVVFNLPAIAGITNEGAFAFKKTDSNGANAITINRASTDTIDGATSLSITTPNSGAILAAENSTSPDSWTSLVFGGSSGGGGGSSVVWTADSGDAPLQETKYSNKCWVFEDGLSQNLYTTIRVPTSYIAGSPIKLKINHFHEAASATQLLSAQTTLIEPGDAFDNTTDQYSSTNTAQTAASKVIASATIDLTNSSGAINSNSVAAGDLLKVRLFRGTDSSTSDLFFIEGSAEVTFS